MGNSARVTVTKGADQEAVQLVAKFRNGGSASATSARFCSSVTLVSGANPSVAWISVPLKAMPADELDPQIALKANGPAGTIKLKARCEISYAEGTTTHNLMCGSLVRYSHNFVEDSLIGEIYDDKWLFSRLTCFGRSVYDPSTESGGSGTGNYYFDATSPLIFGRMGHQDCLDTKWGPVFAPSFRYGWRQQNYEDLTEPEPGQASTRARSWRVEDILLYLRNQYGYEATRPTSQVDYGTDHLPEDSIAWTEEACHFVGSNRVVKDFSLQNDNLLDALQAVARKGGAYDVYLAPIGGYRSELRFVNMGPKTRTGSRLFQPDYDYNVGIDALMNGGDVIHSGNVTESVINCFDEGVAIVGDPIKVERWVGTDLADGTTKIGGTISLEPAWSHDSETAFKNFMNEKQGDPAGFNLACKIWPDVWAAWRIGRGCPVFGGTKWGGTHLGCRYPRIPPSLLTGYNSDGNPKGWQPRSTSVEYKLSAREFEKLSDDEKALGQWRSARTFDALALNPDSTIIYLPGLREASPTPQSWQLNYRKDHFAEDCPDGDFDGRGMGQREIRLTLAMESDWALCARSTQDPNKAGERIDPQSEPYTYVAVSQAMDYLEDVRVNSHPVGYAEIEEPWRTNNFPDKKSEGNELFSDRPTPTSGRMYEHAQWREADVNRIDYAGAVTITRLNPSMYPGLPLTLEGANTIPCFAVVKSVIFDSPTQTTTVQFGPPDTATIYDAPASQKIPAIPLGGSVPTNPTGKKTSNYKYEEGGKPGTTETTGGKSQTQEKGTTGGKSSTQSDPYEDNPTGLGGKDVAPKTSTKSDEQETRGPFKTTSDEKTTTTPGEANWSKSEYSESEEKPKEKKGQQQRHEDKKQARQEAKAKRDARNPDAGFGGFIGKPNSGSMSFGGGPQNDNIMNTMFGKPSSGSINGITDLNKIASTKNMFDVSKPRAQDDKNFAERKRRMMEHDAETSQKFIKNPQPLFGGKPLSKAPQAQGPAQAPQAPTLGTPDAPNMRGFIKKPTTAGNAKGYKKDENGYDIPGSNK